MHDSYNVTYKRIELLRTPSTARSRTPAAIVALATVRRSTNPHLQHVLHDAILVHFFIEESCCLHPVEVQRPCHFVVQSITVLTPKGAAEPLPVCQRVELEQVCGNNVMSDRGDTECQCVSKRSFNKSAATT